MFFYVLNSSFLIYFIVHVYNLIIVCKLKLYLNSKIDNCSLTKFKSRLKQETTLLVVSGWQYSKFLKHWL